jgi:hypothetical protein
MLAVTLILGCSKLVVLLLRRFGGPKHDELPVAADARTRQETRILGSGCMIVSAAPAAAYTRTGTLHMFSGATAAALEELPRPTVARQRQQRVYL